MASDELEFDDDDDFDEFSDFEGECQACDTFTELDDIGLCENCADKFDRDLIRRRDWEYSATAFGVRPEDLEKLRDAVIAKYGAKLELLAEDDGERGVGRG